MKKALETKSKTEFKGRELRVKRATTNERREKKDKKKRDIKEKRKEDHKDRKRHFHERKHPHKPEEGDNKEAKQELKKISPFLENNKKAFSITNDNVDYSNKIAHRGKKDKLKVQEELLDSRDGKTSRA